MANNTNANPMYCDTAAALKTSDVWIKAIYWGSDQTSGKDIAADDDVLISDAAGNRIWGKRASFAGDGDFIPFPDGHLAGGVTVTTLDGGVLYIFTK